MPLKGTSKQTDRSCLVCSALTRIAHLGIDLCRACSVFYRRSKHLHTSYTCRIGTKHCPMGAELNCKRCRYDTIVQLISVQAEHDDVQIAHETLEKAHETTGKSEKPILDKVRAQYKSMTFARLSSELNCRPNPPHPRDIDADTGPFYLADFGMITASVRILMTCILEFGKNVFEDYAKLDGDTRWSLALNFFFRFRMFEGSYRSNKIFPDKTDRFFLSITLYATDLRDKDFFHNAPSGDVEAAIRYIRGGPMLHHRDKALERIRRLKPTEEEFLYIVALMFWSFEGMPLAEDVIAIGKANRERILRELHCYYKEELRLDEYAGRLGELMMFMQVFEQASDLREYFEALRLLNIITEDNFFYNLQRDLDLS